MSQERPTICILALSAIADDPRVRRQAEAFRRAGIDGCFRFVRSN